MEREWTEKEPVVSEWPDEKEIRNDAKNADQPPKLSLKLLYGMIQELQQYNERIAARLDEFEIYLIQVQAARAQLEASAASTIAKAKAVSAMHEQAVMRNEAEPVKDSADKMVAAAAGPTIEAPIASAATASAVTESAVTADASPVEEHPLTASVDSESGAAIISAEAAAGNVYSTDSLAEAVEAPAAYAPVLLADAMSADSLMEVVSAEADLPLVQLMPVIRESSSDDLMTLAMEVLGYSNADHDDSFDDDGLDPGEGINPFDPDGFASGSAYAYAAADASPELLAQQNSSASASLTSPFFTPRSQRHQGTKKKFLNLFGFRTRIS